MNETSVNDVNFTINNNQNNLKFSNYGSVLSDIQTIAWPSTEDGDQHSKVSKTVIIGKEMDAKLQKRRIWINAGLLILAIFFLGMGIYPVQVIQSSSNSKSGLGVASMAVKNGFMIVGSIVAPSVINRFGCKSAIVIGAAFYITYIPANFYPSWVTLMSTATLSGLGNAVLMVAHKVYLARLAHLYAGLVNTEVDRVNSRLFVLLTCAVTLSIIAGNVISSSVLNTGINSLETTIITADGNFSHLQMCGINYCSRSFAVNSITRYSEYNNTLRVFALISFCTVAGIIAVLSLSLLGPLKKLGISSVTDKSDSSPFKSLKDLLRAMKDLRHIMFIPMAMVGTASEAFWTADFTKAFITCSIGMSMLGYVSLWNGLSGTVSCILLGWFNNKHMRSVPVICATLLQMVVVTALFYWNPSASFVVNYWTLSVYTIVYFFGSGIRHFIDPVLVSVVFKDNIETAYSVYHFWNYVSSTTVYAWSSTLCITFKLYFLLVVLFLSFIGYIAMELIVHSKHSSPERTSY